jgi:hypothetical protein
MNKHPLIVIQLNEINFDLVARYIDKYDDLPAFKKIIQNFQSFETFGEDDYQQLEPWIQWVSAQTGKTFAEHEVFRLGDIIKAPDDLEQVFEVLEASGLRIGAVSPMNARNRLSTPAYFIPDPWTETDTDGSGLSRRIAQMLNQTVNENATGKISIRSLVTLIETVLFSLRPIGTTRLLSYAITAASSPWYKALVLDQLIHLIHQRLLRRNNPDVSFVFFNAGAHIQHHYMFNSKVSGGTVQNPDWYIDRKADPIRDMIKAYDRLLGDYIKMNEAGSRLLIATGLSQVPYDRVKFYYRLKHHVRFLELVNIEANHVAPRMTRDFEVYFDEVESAHNAARILSCLILERDRMPLFGDIEVRGTDLFASLTYPYEIKPDDAVLFPDGRRLPNFGSMVAFVAVKNGMHSKRGFGFLSPETNLANEFKKPFHIAKLFDLTLSAALR